MFQQFLVGLLAYEDLSWWTSVALLLGIAGYHHVKLDANDFTTFVSTLLLFVAASWLGDWVLTTAHLEPFSTMSLQVGTAIIMVVVACELGAKRAIFG